jgi:acetoacetate decarboxylase
MGLVRSLDEIMGMTKHFSKGYILGDTNMVMVTFRTKAETVKRVLPPPLEPGPTSTGMAYIAEFHRTNFGVPYNEAALFLSTQYKGEVGKYCLSMPVTNDMAMIGGRENFGFPKKIAETINVKREGNKVTGVCILKGISIIKITVNLTGSVKPVDIPPSTPNYLFKYFLSSDPKVGIFDYNPRLINQHTEFKWGNIESGEGTLALTKSIDDPIYEIPIEEVVTAIYTERTEARMQPGEIVTEVEPLKFLPYSFIKRDWLEGFRKD